MMSGFSRSEIRLKTKNLQLKLFGEFKCESPNCKLHVHVEISLQEIGPPPSHPNRNNETINGD